MGDALVPRTDEVHRPNHVLLVLSNARCRQRVAHEIVEGLEAARGSAGSEEMQAPGNPGRSISARLGHSQ